MGANTDWFHDCKWGVLCHFLADNETTADQWNRQVDAVDVNALADHLASAKVPYFIFSIGQNSGHYCSPNATYDSIVGIRPSKCSERDLIADLYDALSAKDINLLVYLPSGAPENDPVASKALQWEKGQHPDSVYPNGLPADAVPDKRLVGFQRKWENIIAEWSVRWGDKVRGWWFDGCYYARAMYRYDQEPNFNSFAAATKAGNPDSIVAFNPGVMASVVCYTEYEDYTAGEVSNALPVPDMYSDAGRSRFVDQAQYHIMTFLGEGWCAGKPRFPDALAVGYTMLVNQYDGVLTWDVPITPQGRIPAEFLKQLKTIGHTVRPD